MHDDARVFSQIDDFLDKLAPLSLWAKDVHGRRRVFTDRVELETRYDDIEAVHASFSAADASGIRQDRISYHLKRLPRIPLSVKDSYEVIELFQVKKYLTNYHSLRREIPAETTARFGLVSIAQNLTAELEKGGSDAETFFLADTYHEGLASVRASIQENEQAIREERKTSEEGIKKDFGIDLGGRDFVIVDAALVNDGLARNAAISLEPYDNGHFVLRPASSAEHIRLLREREELLTKESALEAEVISRLSALVAAAMPEIRASIDTVIRYDRARTCALLKDRYKLVRPRLSDSLPALTRGIFVPCQEECEKLDLAYTPLNLELEHNTLVLFGSNMGGKTVALKTLLFFQLLAQSGFLVPAQKFETRVFEDIRYIGELHGERLSGLSGFGFEIWRFNEVWKAVQNGLVAFDEFARTTGSHEAEALLSSIIEAYTRRSGVCALFTTHFRGVIRREGVQYSRMMGLDREAAGACLDQEAELQERLMGINRHMRYEVCPDEGEEGESDALAIADMLGADSAILEEARKILRDNDTDTESNPCALL